MKAKIDSVGYYDLKTGKELTKEIVEAIKREDNKNYIRSLFTKYESDINKMTLGEVSDIRKIIKKEQLRYQGNKERVYLKYANGFYMVAMNAEDTLKELSLDTNGFLHLLAFNINKSGVVIYKGNNKRVKSFEKLRNLIGISDGVWRKIKREIDKFDIVRKETIKGETYLLLNPKYSATSYEVTEYKFLVFNHYFKQNLDEIDYIYLTKQFEINPE